MSVCGATQEYKAAARLLVASLKVSTRASRRCDVRHGAAPAEYFTGRC